MQLGRDDPLSRVRPATDSDWHIATVADCHGKVILLKNTSADQDGDDVELEDSDEEDDAWDPAVDSAADDAAVARQCTAPHQLLRPHITLRPMLSTRRLLQRFSANTVTLMVELLLVTCYIPAAVCTAGDGVGVPSKTLPFETAWKVFEANCTLEHERCKAIPAGERDGTTMACDEELRSVILHMTLPPEERTGLKPPEVTYQQEVHAAVTCLHEAMRLNQRQNTLASVRTVCPGPYVRCEMTTGCEDDLVEAMQAAMPPHKGSDELMAMIKCISNDVARDRKRSAEPPPPVGPDGKPIDTDKYEAMVFNGEELVPQSSLTGTSCASMLICQMLSKSACHRPGDWRVAEKWRVKNIHGGGRWFELGPQQAQSQDPRRRSIVVIVKQQGVERGVWVAPQARGGGVMWCVWGGGAPRPVSMGMTYDETLGYIHTDNHRRVYQCSTQRRHITEPSNSSKE